MNQYRIRYKSSMRGVQIVRADTVNGFQPTHDTYLFKIGDEIVAAIPKANVVSVEKVDTAGNDDS